MEEIAVSKFKARCLAVLQRVNRTGRPVLVTRFGKPVAEVVPPRPQPAESSWLGSMRERAEVTGDVVGPVLETELLPHGLCQSVDSSVSEKKRHIDGDRHVFDCFERIRDVAAAMRAALTRGDWPEVGRQLAAEWEHRKALAPGVSTPLIEGLMSRAASVGATAAKVCGAGGGGCLICWVEPGVKERVRAALAAGGAQVLDFVIERGGLRVVHEQTG